MDFVAAAGSGPSVKFAVVDVDAFAHADQPVAAPTSESRDTAPRPVSVTVSSRASGEYRTSTVADAAVPACLRTLVSASWTMRNPASSTPVAEAASSPTTTSSVGCRPRCSGRSPRRDR